jgi:hypothetical protein
MARLSKTDRHTLGRKEAWKEPLERRSPRTVESTPEARARYCRWATEAAKFFKGTKPVRFEGDHWLL